MVEWRQRREIALRNNDDENGEDGEEDGVRRTMKKEEDEGEATKGKDARRKRAMAKKLTSPPNESTTWAYE